MTKMENEKLITEEDNEDICIGCEQVKSKCTCDYGITQGYGEEN